MTGDNILTLAVDNTEEPTNRNVPACLRANADLIESGENAAVTAVLITLSADGSIDVAGMGALPDECAGNALAIIMKAADALRDMLVNASR